MTLIKNFIREEVYLYLFINWNRASHCQLSGQTNTLFMLVAQTNLGMRYQKAINTLSKSKHRHNNKPGIKVYSNMQNLLGMVLLPLGEV
jgi:hypothetical protein